MRDFIKSKQKGSIEEEVRLIELKHKKNKLYEEQLEYIKLNQKFKKYVSFSASGLIKLMLLIFIISLFPNYRIHIFIGLISYRVIKILLKDDNKILNIIKAFLSYSTLFLFFKMLELYGIWIVLLISFLISFIYNLIKNWRK